MNINSILNQVLGAGQQMSQNSRGSLNSSNIGSVLGGLLGGSNNSSAGGLGGSLGSLLGNSDTLKKLGGGAAAAGILSMILGGSNGSRGLSGSLAKMGSLAAIGTLAYKAYQSWQEKEPQQAAAANLPAQIQPSAERAPAEAEQNSRTVLKAMIAAAAADGEISQAEQSAIIDQVGQESSEAQAWLQQIVQNPPSAQDIGREVGNDPALAAEVYLASRIVCGDLDRKEIAYLVSLQQALGLSDALVEQLEKQAGF